MKSIVLIHLLPALVAVGLNARADIVTDWNNAALNAVRAEKTNPPKGSRAMAIAHAAIYDAANGVQRTHRPYHVSDMAPAGASLDAAIAAAAYTSLYELFTNPDVRSTNFQALYDVQLAAIPDGQPKTDGITWGQSVAQAMLALRADDGSTNIVPYTPGTEPGRWKPTPPASAPALLPGWGFVVPFCMTSGSQFRPQAPPPVGSAAYSFEFNTVKAYGGTVSTVRTSNQTEVALFWNDGAGTATPPGHWNVIAQGVSQDKGLTVLENARLFALLNLAAADAAICAWDAKFIYDYWRPVTAIREADTDNNPETETDPTWSSLIPTPPFPEFTSGHSTFSRSAAVVLAGFFGEDNIPFTTTTDGLPGVTRNYPGFSAAADEAGISRLYGGIHWPSANLHGQSGGRAIGLLVMSYFLQPLNALRFSRVNRLGGNTELELQVEPNRTYVIRASSDLKTWEEIATVSSGDGIVHFNDVNAPDLQLRFYEAVGQ
jgi:membrane-associated phospholipid phosphatase